MMSSAIAAADANREFSKMLRQVRAGHSVTITSHGRPVARMVPISEADTTRLHARTRLLERLTHATVRTIGTWSRDELYERDRGSR